MGFTNKYPYTDFHELNADWIIEAATEAKETADSFEGRVSSLETDVAPIKAAMPGIASSISDLTAGLGRVSGQVTTNTEAIADNAETIASQGDQIGDIDTRVTTLENQPSVGGITEYLRFGTGGTPLDWDARITYTYLDDLIATTASADKTVNIILVEDDELGNTWYYALNEGEYQISAGTPRGQFTFVCRKPVIDGNNVTGYKVCTVTVNKNAATPTYTEVYEAVNDDWTDVPLTAGANVAINSYYCKRKGSLIVYDVFMNITDTTTPGEVLVDGFPPLVTAPTSRLTVGRYKAFGTSTFDVHFCGITTNLNYAFEMYNGDELRVWGSYYI